MKRKSHSHGVFCVTFCDESLRFLDNYIIKGLWTIVHIILSTKLSIYVSIILQKILNLLHCDMGHFLDKNCYLNKWCITY
jgi:hypothetical protein